MTIANSDVRFNANGNHDRDSDERSASRDNTDDACEEENQDESEELTCGHEFSIAARLRSGSVDSFLAMIGTMTKAAIGSAHHQPRARLRTSPIKRMADK